MAAVATDDVGSSRNSSRNSSCSSAGAALALGRQNGAAAWAPAALHLGARMGQQHGHQQHWHLGGRRGSSRWDNSSSMEAAAGVAATAGRGSSVTTALLSFRHPPPRGLLESFRHPPPPGVVHAVNS